MSTDPLKNNAENLHVSEGENKEWVLAERLRPFIPERVFSVLCWFPWRGWMLIQPFRWMLFKKVPPAGSLPNTPNQAGLSESDGFKAAQQALSPEEIELTKMVRAALAGAPPFRPYAYFDEQLDCIRIGWRDTSVTESRLSPALTVMLANYDANGEPATEAEIVGVVIKGVAHACATARVGADIPHQIATKIDALLAVTEAK